MAPIRFVVAAASCVAVAAFSVVASATPTTVLVASATNGSLGKILVSARGRTLYHLSAEPRNVVKCTGACATDWPPLVIAAGTKPVAGPGVRPPLLGTVRRSDGTIQVTYAGMPLYLYSGDKRAGSVEGQGVGGVAWLGGAWHTVTPSGTVVKTAVPGGSSGGTKSSGSESEPGMTCY